MLFMFILKSEFPAKNPYALVIVEDPPLDVVKKPLLKLPVSFAPKKNCEAFLIFGKYLIIFCGIVVTSLVLNMFGASVKF